MRAPWLLAALPTAGCGGGTGSRPVAPSTPAPAPAPPEPRVCTDERDVALGYLT